MVLGNTQTRGIFVICLGLWLLPLTWAIYAKYERQRKMQDGASVPLVVFLSISAAVLAVGLFFEYRKRKGAALGGLGGYGGGLGGYGGDSQYGSPGNV